MSNYNNATGGSRRQDRRGETGNEGPSWWQIAATGAAIVGGVAAVAVAANNPTVKNFVTEKAGFTEKGIEKGSLAAKLQSNKGSVQKGSLFSKIQSKKARGGYN